MFVKKDFQLVQPFLANLHSTSPNKYSCMYSMTPKFFQFFLAYEHSKYAEFYDIKSVEIMKKVHPEKVLCQTLLQVSSIEEEKLRFFKLFLPITFLLANFSHFSQQFRNQRKILRCSNTHIQILQRKSFYVILALFFNFKGSDQ